MSSSLPQAKNVNIYLENFEKYNVNDAVWGGGAMEALKKSLGYIGLTDSYDLIVSNDWHSILNDMDKHNDSKVGDINFYCDLCSSSGLRRKQNAMEILMWEEKQMFHCAVNFTNKNMQ